MRIKYTGDQDGVTVRGVEFPRGKAVTVDDVDLAAKMLAWPDVVQARTRKAKADGENKG